MIPIKSNGTSHFSGRLLIYTINDEFITGFKVENGEFIAKYVKNNSTTLTSKIAGGRIELHEVIIEHNYRRPSSYSLDLDYFDWAIGASNNENSNNADYQWNSEGGSGGSGGATDSFNFDDKITTNLPPCVDSIVNDLKTMKNGKFSEIISKFSGLNPAPENFNWEISKGNLPTNTPGGTRTIVSDGLVTTTLNENDLSISTDLSLAKTIIHESFHAYLVYVYRYRDIDKSYVNLVDTYFKDFGNNLNNAHHNLIANTNMIKDISSALKEYGVSKGYVLSQQFYDDMSWGGLAGTKAFSELPDDVRERILNSIYAEYKNSNTNGVVPKGHKACN